MKKREQTEQPRNELPSAEELGLTPEDFEVSRFDPADYLRSPEDCALYLNEALATGSARLIADSLGVIARARGMSELARRAGVNRQNLYSALAGKGTPRLDTFIAVLQALGLGLTAFPQTAQAQKQATAESA